MYEMFCYMVRDGSLSEPLRNILLFTAVEMLEEGTRRKRLRRTSFEIDIRTRFERGLLASVAGTIFTAGVEIEGQPKLITARYIVRDLDSIGELDITKVRWVE